MRRFSLSRFAVAACMLACAFVPSAARPAPPPAGDAAAAARIDTTCAASVDLALKSEPRAFARMYGRDEHGQWRVADEAVLHRIQVDPNIYSEVAKVWMVDGHIVLVDIEARSLELRANSTYCFRNSGTLARVIETSAGLHVRDEEERYLDEGGHVVATHSQFFNIYPRPGSTLSPDLRPSTPSLYLTVQGLPFYSMLALRE